jgi:heterodisulfide reductase subunit D
VSRVGELAAQYGIDAARREAGVLKTACPVARVNEEFSPEKIAVLASGDPEGLLRSPAIWECLACGLCREVTAGAVDMSRFVRELRSLAAEAGSPGSETHGGLLMAAQRLDSTGAFAPKRAAWITDSLQVSLGKGEYLYWAGGAPFFAAALPDLQPTAVESARAALRLLNHLGIRPVVLGGERFSGHDLLWTGNVEAFRRLAERNLQAIRESGARKLIVSSPEDYYTLAVSYRECFGGLGFEVRHISELLAENLSRLRLKEWKAVVSYHDPCRLGRGMGVYDPPRELLRAIPGVQLVEMEHARELSLCCGTSCWTGCNRYSKLMQASRLQEAAATGAAILVTSCWECALHFRCAMRSSAWQQARVRVADLVALVGALLEE